MPTREPYLIRKYKYDTQIAHIKKWGGGRLTRSELNSLFILRDSLKNDAELRNSNSAPTQTYLDRLDYLKSMKEMLEKEPSALSMLLITEEEQEKRLKDVKKEILLCEANITNTQKTPPVIDDESLRNLRITNLYAGGYISKDQLKKVNGKDSSLKNFISDPKVYNLLIQEPIKFSMNVVMECSADERKRIQGASEKSMLGVVESLPEVRNKQAEEQQYQQRIHISEYERKLKNAQQESRSAAETEVSNVVQPLRDGIDALTIALKDPKMAEEKAVLAKCVEQCVASLDSFSGSKKNKLDVQQLKSQIQEHARQVIIKLSNKHPTLMSIVGKLFNWAVGKITTKVDNSLPKLEAPPEANDAPSAPSKAWLILQVKVLLWKGNRSHHIVSLAFVR